MKYLFLLGRVNSSLFFAFLFSALLSLSSALAGGMPSGTAKGMPAEESVATPVEEPVAASVEEPVAMPVEEPVAASAETKDLSLLISGFTIGARGAASILDNSDFSAPPAGPEGSLSYSEGYSFSFMLGYAFENGLRLEAETGYTGENCAEEVGTERVKGKVTAFTFMMNAYYDLDLGSALVPYVGTGLGGANVSSKIEPYESTATNVYLDESSYVLVYQVGAGLGYKISEFLGFGNDLTVSFDYRYLASFQDVNIQDSSTGAELESFGGHYVGGGLRLEL